MSAPILFWVGAGLFTLLTVIFITWIFFHRLPPVTRWVYGILTGILLILAVLHAYAALSGGLLGRLWLLNANEDWSIPTIVSSAELLAVVASAWAVGFLLDDQWDSLWQRLFWLGLGLVFLYIAVDDYLTFHEHLVNFPFRIVAAVFGLLLVGATLLIFRQKLRAESSLFVPLVVGLGITVVMGTLFERYVIWKLICHGPIPSLGPICDEFHYFEEFGEFLGVTVILITLVAYLERHLTPRRGRLTLIGTGGIVTFGVALMVANMWFFPGLEARYRATPASVTYLDGDLSLVGYRVSPGVHHPGDTVAVTLYWRANHKITENVGVSLHLVTPDEYQSAYQVNLLSAGRYPTSAWPVGGVERRVFRLEIPSDLDTPVGYMLTVTPWVKSGEVSLVDSDRFVLSPPTVGLDYLPVVGTDPLPVPVQVDEVNFAGLFTLTGYDLPEDVSPGETLLLDLWWNVSADVEQEYVQFLHIIDSDGQAVASLDAPPLGGRLPTLSWRAGMSFVEPIAIDLPADLPPGEYHIYTGMYTLPDVVRVPLTAAGEPLQDNLVYLGSVHCR